MPPKNKKQVVVWMTPAQRDTIDAAAQHHNHKGNKSELIKSLLRAYCEENSIEWPENGETWGRYRQFTEYSVVLVPLKDVGEKVLLSHLLRDCNQRGVDLPMDLGLDPVEVDWIYSDEDGEIGWTKKERDV